MEDGRRAKWGMSEKIGSPAMTPETSIFGTTAAGRTVHRAVISNGALGFVTLIRENQMG